MFFPVFFVAFLTGFLDRFYGGQRFGEGGDDGFFLGRVLWRLKNDINNGK